MRVLQSLPLLLALWVAPACALQPGDNAPDFSGTTLEGGTTLRLSALRGTVVYLDFWATWCTPCRTSLPLLAQLQHELGPRGLQVLGVNTDHDETAVRRWVRDSGVDYPVLRGVPDVTLKAYGIAAMPSAYLIDRTGRVRAVHAGFRASQFAAVRDEIESVLGESKQ